MTRLDDANRKSVRSFWQEELRKTRGLENCQLPKGIEFFGDDRDVILRLSAASLQTDNMQSDAAAFDAWALALLNHCRVETIGIEVDGVPDLHTQHFQRFLYRVHRFSELFRLEGDLSGYLENARSLDGKLRRLLNAPGKRLLIEPGKRPRQFGDDEGAPLSSESNLENALVGSSQFRKAFNLEKVMRQWPVGLFANEIRANENRIFTGGKSAIDLIGISGDTLTLFELKKKGNRKAGAISELLFYTNMMRDALRGEFEFEADSTAKEGDINYRDIMSCKRIRSIILAPDFHPLVWCEEINPEDRVLSRLNRAVKDKWMLPVTFEAAHICVPDSVGSDFQFMIEAV